MTDPYFVETWRTALEFAVNARRPSYIYYDRGEFDRAIVNFDTEIEAVVACGAGS
jgi:hypothetical protein